MVDVVVRGAPDRVETLTSAMVVPYVDVSNFEPTAGAETIAIQLQDLASGLELVRIEPPTAFISGGAPRPGRAAEGNRGRAAQNAP